MITWYYYLVNTCWTFFFTFRSGLVLSLFVFPLFGWMSYCCFCFSTFFHLVLTFLFFCLGLSLCFLSEVPGLFSFLLSFYFPLSLSYEIMAVCIIFLLSGCLFSSILHRLVVCCATEYLSLNPGENSCPNKSILHSIMRSQIWIDVTFFK